MRLVTFVEGGQTRIGVCPRGKESVVDLAGTATDFPPDMTALVRGGPDALKRLAEAVSNGPSTLPLSEVTLLAPFPRPARNIFCVGKNYPEHVWEFHSSGFDATAGTEVTRVTSAMSMSGLRVLLSTPSAISPSPSVRVVNGRTRSGSKR